MVLNYFVILEIEIIINQISNMLNIEDHVPIKETLVKLMKFPRLSVVEKFTPKFFETPLEGAKAIAKEIK